MVPPPPYPLAEYHFADLSRNGGYLIPPYRKVPQPFPDISFPGRAKNDATRPYNRPNRANNVWKKAKSKVFGPELHAF